MGKESGKALIDRIEYYMEHPEDEDYFNAAFIAEERNILCTVRDFERNRCIMRLKEIRSPDKSRAAEEVLRVLEAEKGISFLLKGQIDAHIDFLLQQESAEAWMEILTWYQVIDGKGLIIDRFWEFSVLKTMLDAFVEELKLFYSGGKAISVLSIRSMKELTEVYFQTVFLLRRIEYDVDPADGMLYRLTEGKLSLAAVKIILRDAKITHREKVEKAIDDQG